MELSLIKLMVNLLFGENVKTTQHHFILGEDSLICDSWDNLNPYIVKFYEIHVENFEYA